MKVAVQRYHRHTSSSSLSSFYGLALAIICACTFFLKLYFLLSVPVLLAKRDIRTMQSEMGEMKESIRHLDIQGWQIKSKSAFKDN